MSVLSFMRVKGKKSEGIEMTLDASKSEFCEVRLPIGECYFSLGRLIRDDGELEGVLLSYDSGVTFDPTFRSNFKKLVAAHVESIYLDNRSSRKEFLEIVNYLDEDPYNSQCIIVSKVADCLKKILLEVSGDKIQSIFLMIPYSQSDIRDVRENLFKQIRQQFEYSKKGLISNPCKNDSIQALALEIHETIDSEIRLIESDVKSEKKPK